MSKKVLILGNSSDRLLKSNEILKWEDDIFVSNYAFQEYRSFKKINIVGTVHEFVVQSALDFKKEHNLSYEIINQKIEDISNNVLLYKEYLGFSTGTQLILEAIHREYNEIYLSGFCFINNDRTDIYTPNIICDNFINQWNFIKDKYKDKNILFKYL